MQETLQKAKETMTTTLKHKDSISPTQEDYLEKILDLLTLNGVVRVTDLAQIMNISKPSVNKAINNLKEHGLVEQERYSFITLTEKGQCVAKNVRKRHDILKELLLLIGVDEEKAEEEACEIEHTVSVNTVEKLNDFLKKIEPLL